MAQEESELEDEYGRQLRNERAQESESTLESEGGGEESAVSSENHTVTFVLAFLVAVFSDLADIFVIGAIPLVGDVLDAATGAILAALFLSIGGRRKIKRLIPVAGATIIEFLPFGITDIMPTFTLEVIYTWYTTQKEKQQASA